MRPPRAPLRPRVAGLLGSLAIVVAGCSSLTVAAPTPTPEDFPGIVGRLGQYGVTASNWVSGDAGCSDSTLNPTAIRFDAQGLDRTSPVQMRIYIFRNRETWERRAADADKCAQAWATDPSNFEVVEGSPYVLAGQGPWPAAFDQAVHQALTTAAGNGG